MRARAFRHNQQLRRDGAHETPFAPALISSKTRTVFVVMPSSYRNRVQIAFALTIGALLAANLLAFALAARALSNGAPRAQILLVVFFVTLLASLPCALLLPRWLMRPFKRLVSEAERAANNSHGAAARDETEFVLDTFKTVVARMQTQQRELARLSASDRERARSAEQLSGRIVGSIPSGLIAFDAKGAATVVNAPAQQLLEIDNADGAHFRTALVRTPELAQMVEAALIKGETFRRAEVNATTQDGRALRLGVTVAPLDTGAQESNPNASLSKSGGALCLITDLTEVTQLRETVALKRNLESLGEMSAGLAHEFKNSLAALHGYAQLLQTLTHEREARHAADEMLEEVRSLTNLVTSFLNFARPQPMQFAETSLDELIRACAEELDSFYEERSVALEITGEFPTIQADERMLRQAFLNLLRNAAEAIPPEQNLRRVTIRGAALNDSAQPSAQIEITDTGAGIAARDLQRLFIPFFTTKANGTGIGLALAHRIITEHNGSLAAANSPDGGAIFKITLPINHNMLDS